MSIQDLLQENDLVNVLLGTRLYKNINITDLANRLDDIELKNKNRIYWINFAKRILIKDSLLSITKTTYFLKSFKRFLLFQRKYSFIKWKAMFNWRKLAKGVMIGEMDEELKAFFDQRNIRKWGRITFLLLKDDRYNRLINAYNERENEILVLDYFETWKIRVEIRKRNRDNIRGDWKYFIFKKLQIEHLNQHKNALRHMNSYIKWINLTKGIYYKHMNRLMIKESYRYNLINSFQKFLENVLRKHRYDCLKKGRYRLDSMRKWIKIAFKYTKFANMKNCREQRVILNNALKIIDFSSKLVQLHRINIFHDTRATMFREKELDFIGKIFGKWREKAIAKEYAWKFIKSHLNGIIRDYSNHIQNQAALVIQKASRGLISRINYRKIVMYRCFLSWRNIIPKFVKRLLEWPEIALNICRTWKMNNFDFIQLDISDMSQYRNIITKKHHENMNFSDCLSKRIKMNLFIPDIVPNIGERLFQINDKYHKLNPIVRYNTKLSLDVDINFMVYEIVQKLFYKQAKQKRPESKKLIRYIASSYSLDCNFFAFDTNISVKPIEILSRTRPEKVIVCSSFDTRKIFDSNFYTFDDIINFNRIMEPVFNVRFLLFFTFSKLQWDYINNSLTNSINKISRIPYIPKFDIVYSPLASVLDRNDFGFYYNDYNNIYSDMINNIVVDALNTNFDAIDTYVFANLIPKYRKHVQWTLPQEYDGAPFEVRLSWVDVYDKFDSCFEFAIYSSTRLTYPDILQNHLNVIDYVQDVVYEYEVMVDLLLYKFNYISFPTVIPTIDNFRYSRDSFSSISMDNTYSDHFPIDVDSFLNSNSNDFIDLNVNFGDESSIINVYDFHLSSICIGVSNMVILDRFRSIFNIYYHIDTKELICNSTPRVFVKKRRKVKKGPAVKIIFSQDSSSEYSSIVSSTNSSHNLSLINFGGEKVHKPRSIPDANIPDIKSVVQRVERHPMLLRDPSKNNTLVMSDSTPTFPSDSSPKVSSNSPPSFPSASSSAVNQIDNIDSANSHTGTSSPRISYDSESSDKLFEETMEALDIDNKIALNMYIGYIVKGFFDISVIHLQDQTDIEGTDISISNPSPGRPLSGKQIYKLRKAKKEHVNENVAAKAVRLAVGEYANSLKQVIKRSFGHILSTNITGINTHNELSINYHQEDLNTTEAEIAASFEESSISYTLPSSSTPEICIDFKTIPQFNLEDVVNNLVNGMISQEANMIRDLNMFNAYVRTPNNGQSHSPSVELDDISMRHRNNRIISPRIIRPKPHFRLEDIN